MLGLLHLIHSPLLILFPFVIVTFETDIFFIVYFLTIMFSYTFINGECPISYIYKLSIDKNYIAGSNINYYPEMEYLLHNKIEYYFGTMTFLYVLTLFIVIFRTETFFHSIFTMIILANYFLFIRKKLKYFEIVQEITKYVLLFTICLFLKLLIVL